MMEEQAMESKQVFLWELTRVEFREKVESGQIKAAIVPTGSTEQHLEHLAMIHDMASALCVSKLAAEKLYPSVIISTPVAIGMSEHWMAHPGTLTVRGELLKEVVHDVCDSLKRGGISKILIVNGHAGNTGPIREHVSSFGEELEADIRFCSYWDLIPKEVALKYMESGRYPAHAQEFETSIALAAFPGRVRKDNIADEGAKLATAEKGKAMIDAAVEGIVALLEEMM